MDNDFDTQKKALMKEVATVLNEVEGLYETSVENGSEQAQALKEKVRVRLDQAREHLHSLESSVVEKAREATARTDELVREKPYQAMGLAALGGLVVGMLLCHSCKRG